MPATSFCDIVHQVRTMTADSSSLETLPNQQRPRRWFRFSLRTVLLAITIVGIVLGMFCARYLRVRGVGITDKSLPLLHNMTNLKKLILDDTSVDKTSDAAKQLTQALPGYSIRYPETPEEIEIRKSFDDWKFGRRTNNPPANP